jgi:hypothetical protein
MNNTYPELLLTERMSVEQRISNGKALRLKFWRSKLDDYAPPANRVDPVSILEEQGKTRLQDLVEKMTFMKTRQGISMNCWT